MRNSHQKNAVGFEFSGVLFAAEMFVYYFWDD